MTFNPIRTLESNTLLIRKLLAEDITALSEAISDPKIWEDHPQHDRYQPAKIQVWFEQALQDNALAIFNKNNDQLIGSSRYYEIDQPQGEVSIGYTFLVTKHWGGKTNLELKKLMFRHAWQYFETVWLHIAEDNIRSRKAAEKIGASLHHIGNKYGMPYCWYLLPKNSL